MERVRLHIRSASKLYSVELAIFLLVCYATLFGISLATFVRSVIGHGTAGILTAGFFTVMSFTCLCMEAQVVRAMTNRE